MLTNTGVSFNPGSTQLLLTMDTMHMAAGRYTIDIVAYVYDEFGNEQFLDGVFPGFVLEIEDRVSESNELVWLHQYWGHVRLHDIQIVR